MSRPRLGRANRLESADAINVMGSYDAITYKSGSPSVNIVGKNSTAGKEK